MVDQIKQIVKSAGNASVPCTFLFGTVISAEPLQVQVDNRFVIGAAALVTLRQQSGGVYCTHRHKHTCAYNGATVQDEPEENWESLKAGDKLALLRELGGQRFLVLGVVE